MDDHPDAYHILLIDEFDNRMKFMMEHYELSEKRAIQVLNSEDRRRVSLYNRLGKKDYDNPALYHIVLNMSRFDLESALKLITAMVDLGGRR
ncbi:MAG: hypothetical protein B6245_24135 [Desulfobacteraceae bacterium 4572_88]|nr:MAG: hypothetical protein B6245_24135 [Desulfobacteraceae bacterium 4572_88]